MRGSGADLVLRQGDWSRLSLRTLLFITIIVIIVAQPILSLAESNVESTTEKFYTSKKYSEIINEYKLPFDRNVSVIATIESETVACSKLVHGHTKDYYIIVEYQNRFEDASGILVIDLRSGAIVEDKDIVSSLIRHYYEMIYFSNIVDSLKEKLPAIIIVAGAVSNTTYKILDPYSKIIENLDKIKNLHFDLSFTTLYIWDIMMELYPELGTIIDSIYELYDNLKYLYDSASETYTYASQLYNTIANSTNITLAWELAQHLENSLELFYDKIIYINNYYNKLIKLLEDLYYIIYDIEIKIADKIPVESIRDITLNLLSKTENEISRILNENYNISNFYYNTAKAANDVNSLIHGVRYKSSQVSNEFINKWEVRMSAPLYLLKLLLIPFLAIYALIILIVIKYKNIKIINKNLIIFIFMFLSLMVFMTSMLNTWAVIKTGWYLEDKGYEKASSDFCAKIEKFNSNILNSSNLTTKIEKLDNNKIIIFNLITNLLHSRDLNSLSYYLQVLDDLQNNKEATAVESDSVSLLILLSIIFMFLTIFMGIYIITKTVYLIINKKKNVINYDNIYLYKILGVTSLILFLMANFPGKMLGGVEYLKYRNYTLYYGFSANYTSYSTIITPGILLLLNSMLLAFPALIIARSTRKSLERLAIKTGGYKGIEALGIKLKKNVIEANRLEEYYVVTELSRIIIKMLIILYSVHIFVVWPLIILGKFKKTLIHRELFLDLYNYEIIGKFMKLLFSDKIYVLIVIIIMTISFFLWSGLFDLLIKVYSIESLFTERELKRRAKIFWTMEIIIYIYMFAYTGLAMYMILLWLIDSYDLQSLMAELEDLTVFVFILTLPGLFILHLILFLIIKDLSNALSIYEEKYPDTSILRFVWLLAGIFPLLLPFSVAVLSELKSIFSKRSHVAEMLLRELEGES